MNHPCPSSPGTPTISGCKRVDSLLNHSSRRRCPPWAFGPYQMVYEERAAPTQKGGSRIGPVRIRARPCRIEHVGPSRSPPSSVQPALEVAGDASGD